MRNKAYRGYNLSGYDYDGDSGYGQRGPRRRAGGGCGGCLCVLAIITAAGLVGILRFGPTALQMAAKGIEHTVLVRLGFANDATPAAAGEDLGYAAGLLNETQQGVYLQLLAGIRDLEQTITVYDAQPTDIDPAVTALIGDHPELFWFDGSCTYTYTDLAGIVELTPTYTLSPSEVGRQSEAIEAEVSAFLDSLPADADDYTVAKAAYEYVIGTTDYVLDAADSQNIQSVFIGHASVCAGYAHAFEYLMQRAGIPCAYVEGSIASTGEDHAWVLVQLNSAYTFVDPTWGDPTYGEEEANLPARGIIYDYLGLTTDELLRDQHVFAQPDKWPTCDATEFDYYRREGLFFEGYDEAGLSEAFWRQAQAGNQAAFKFGSEEAYEQAKNDLRDAAFLNEELLTIAAQRGQDSMRYTYTVSDSLHIVKLFW